jgi:hypothetical protein
VEISALVPEEKGKADDGPKGGGSGWRSGIRNIRWPASFASFSWSLFSEEGKQRYGRLNGIIMPAGAMSKKHACYQFSVAAGILKSQSYRCLIFFMGIPPRVAAAQLIAGPERSIQF